MVDNPFTRLRVALRNEALRNLEQERCDSELESACRALVTSKEFKIAELSAAAREICGAQCTVLFERGAGPPRKYTGVFNMVLVGEDWVVPDGR